MAELVVKREEPCWDGIPLISWHNWCPTYIPNILLGVQHLQPLPHLNTPGSSKFGTMATIPKQMPASMQQAPQATGTAAHDHKLSTA
jgi:hypothetical protein